MKIILLFTLLSLLSFLSSEVLTYEKVLKNRKGIQLYEQEKFENAEQTFQENAIRYPRQGDLHFNLGNSFYKAGKLEEAENAYHLALRDKDFEQKSKVFHNLGNVKFEQKDYKNALNYYRNALLEDQNNADSRYNYELAAQYLQRQQQQPQSSESEEQNDDKKEQQQNQQQQQSDDDKKEEQQQKQKLTDDEKQKLDNAEQILRALQQKEKELMKDEKKSSDAQKTGKYW
jgi:tetratricopeptide (TPR) repeat protein